MNKKYFTPWDEYEKKLMKNKKFQEESAKLEPSFKLAVSIIEKRLALKLSQRDLAKRAKTSQSAIARVESMNHKPSLAFLERIAAALNSQLQITLT